MSENPIETLAPQLSPPVTRQPTTAATSDKHVEQQWETLVFNFAGDDDE